jgi:hypothetical protein
VSKGRRDRASGAEGEPPTVGTVLVRLAVWFRWLADADCAVPVPPEVFAALAAVSEELATTVNPE